MSGAAPDPFAVLGVTPAASDDELRRAYRDLVKRHHPDHNGGSAESAARFEQIQNAYAAVVLLRRGSEGGGSMGGGSMGGGSMGGGSPGASADPDIEDRIARMERELADKRAMASKRAAQPRAAQPACS